jgi:hypothetical protein
MQSCLPHPVSLRPVAFISSHLCMFVSTAISCYVRAMNFAHLILLYFIALLILGEECKL